MFIKEKLYTIIGLIVVVIILLLTLWGGIFVEGMKTWTVLKSFQVDLNNDGKLEKVVLSSEVEVDKSGKILWDDSQWWKMTVNEEELFKEFITLGTIYISIGIEEGNNLPSIILVKDDEDTFTVLKFSAQKGSKSYKKQNTLFINKQVRTAIPFYERPEKN